MSWLSKLHHLIPRLLTGFVLLFIFLAGLFLLSEEGGVICTGLIIGLAAWEWQRLAGGMCDLLARLYPALTAIGFIVLYFLSFSEILIALFLVVTFFWLAVVPCWLRFKWPLALVGSWNMVLGWFLLFPAGFSMLVLRADHPSVLLVIMGMAWVADTAAYFVGRFCGRHPLAPQVSPGKTWEGVLGALFAIIAYCTYFHKKLALGLGFSADSSVILIVLVGVVLLIASIMGDLLESLLKRQRGVKESGYLLPGHGGILDRIDSLLALLPTAAAFHFHPVLIPCAEQFILCLT